ncbi:MAG: hypothetical protein AB8B91_20025 [Rubripirellula sp.]
MVQIDSAESGGARPQVAVGQSNVDSEAITEEAIAMQQELSDDPPTLESGFVGEEQLAEQESLAADTAHRPNPLQWQSERTQRSRQIALVVALSISGLLLAIAVFSWFVRSSQTSNDRVAEADPTTVEPAVEVESEVQAAPEAEADPEDPSEPKAEQPVVDVVPETPEAESVETPVIPTPVEPTVMEPAIAEPVIPADLLQSSPLELDNAANEPVGEDDQSKMMELPPELQIFTQDLLVDGAQQMTPTLKAPPTMEEIVEIEEAAEAEDPIVAARTKELNLRADLGIELALSSKGYPLADLMLLIGQVTTVPIQIDWVSLDLAGIDIKSRVKVPQGWHTAGEILDIVGKSLGAEIREEESLVVFTVSDATFDQAFQEITDLSDFHDTELAINVLNRFLGKAGKALEVGTTREEKQLAAFAVDSLRRMHELPPKVADDRLRHWALAAERDSVQWPLVKVGMAGPQTDAPIAIAEFLRETARRNGATCVVNWHDSHRQSVTPEKVLFPHNEADPTTTLQSALSRFDLQVRQVDQQRWWVGTEPTYDLLPVVVWTAPLGESRDRFVRQITSIMSGKPSDPFQIAIDPQSDRALLLLPRYVVRQLPKIIGTLAAN